MLLIKNLTKTYFEKKKIVKRALKGINLEINEGEILTLLGVNGAGKTTLSTIIASLHPPTSGDVIWNGQSIFKQLSSYRRIVGLCPQKPNLDRRMNLEDNLFFSGISFGMSDGDAKAKAIELMDKFDLGNYAQALAFTLSGGYRQRFLIARTLMHAPKLVILDEPTIGLDPHVRHHLWDTIRDLKKDGSTVLLTTHYLDEAETLSDRVCIIDDGQIKHIDTPKALIEGYKQKNLESVFIHLIDQLKENHNEH